MPVCCADDKHAIEKNNFKDLEKSGSKEQVLKFLGFYSFMKENLFLNQLFS